jgi:glycosyltransferase involved in cell wall biosynthesis
MVAVSIVIITKSEADIIAGCIDKAKQITDDIVIIYNGIEDYITYLYGCRVLKKNWDGYGANKNKGVQAAKYNWILSIDSDEIPDDELIRSLHKIDLADPNIVYDIKFTSYFGGKAIRHGSWGRDHHLRLFNRTVVKWSEVMVHETLVLPANAEIRKIAGSLHHYSVKDVNDYDVKCSYYAKLSAKKYFKAGKRANAVKLYVSPVFGFLKNYIVRRGFLDGREGWEIAKTMVKNTWRKYHFLEKMENTPLKEQPARESYVVEY